MFFIKKYSIIVVYYCKKADFFLLKNMKKEISIIENFFYDSIYR